MPKLKGLTLEEAERLGVAAEHPDHPDRKAVAKKTKLSTLNCLGQNKTEAAFDRHLADLKARGLIRDFRFEPLKLRLAGRTYYRIDFVVWLIDGTLAAFEIKGFMRDDAAVKLKVAPEVFPFMDYYLVYKDGAGWDIRDVNRWGIGRSNVGMEWV